ncbi:glycosyltransferase family 2 protein [Pedobacter miscanthi]|uniref:glycosyltransferase family 2 protein n=1 Tax=Pedobacter miscanthi TaxID=2259170 RepID=UPI0013144B79|nr:glycosyltransferase family A protein [Pedobacter miscanthi]
MVKENKLVSVIIPAYNAADTIIETLNSVYAQTYLDLEVVVINDGSTDNTLSLLENYPKILKIISTENKGVSHARKLGFNHASGDYIQYLDADDLLIFNKIEKQLNALLSTNADVAYGDWQKFITQDSQLLVTEAIVREMKPDLEISIFTDFWCPPAAILYSRRVCSKLEWKENLPIIQDARYFLDAAILKATFEYTPGIMAQYRTAQSQSLSQKSDANFVKDLFENTKEIHQIWEKDYIDRPDKKQAIIQSLRHCINRLTVLDKNLAQEAIQLLLTIVPHYLPPEKGLLRTLSRIIGYRNAEIIAGMKRMFNS